MQDPSAPDPRPARSDRAAKRARAEAAAARRGIAPILGGVMIDIVDVVSVVGLGGVGGALVGGLITYAVCSRQGMSRLPTAALTFLGALYCLLPFTEAVPLATLLAIVWQLRPRERALPAATDAAFETVAVTQAGPARRDAGR